MDWSAQYRHPLWQKKRLEVLEAHDYTCAICGSKDKFLHVHHNFYKKGAKIWEYTVYELSCLCEDCHSHEHALDDAIKSRIFDRCVVDKETVLGYVLIPTEKPTTEAMAAGMLQRSNIPASDRLVDLVLKQGLSDVDLINLIGTKKYAATIRKVEKCAEKILLGAIKNGDI